MSWKSQVAQLASLGLDEDRSRLYVDLVLNALSEAARRALRTMLPFKYEYQSDFAKQYYGQGKAEGREEGREEGKAEGQAALVHLVIRQLGLRFGPVDEPVKERLAAASIAQLDAIGERLMTAQTLQEALGRPSQILKPSSAHSTHWAGPGFAPARETVLPGRGR